MEGYERKPYYAKANEFNAITSGDTIKLKSLFASGIMKLSTEKRTLSENPLKNMKYHFVIAASLGYSSQSAFTYAFRRFTGMTPKKYREMNYVVKF